MTHKLNVCVGLAAFIGSVTIATAAETIPVGQLVDYTGPTANISTPYGHAVQDSIDYINDNGGIDGRKIELKTSDYSYQVPRAIATYKSWVSGFKPVLIQGWGTGDTEALSGFVAKDKIVYMSASYSGHLTDPTGKSPHTKRPAPYNFFYGPTYSDGCRALIEWAKGDWSKKGGEGAPAFVHMGDNHPMPEAPRAACESYAKDLGFEVLPPIRYSMAPGDFKSQCLSLKQSGADYAFMGNVTGANISLLRSCDTVGVDETQFMTMVWGFDENVVKSAGEASDGIVWPVGSALWDSKTPGMNLIHEIMAKNGRTDETLHYIRGVCSAFYMRDAMTMAGAKGDITGPTIKAAFETMTNHVPTELEGVCVPHSWTHENHRGTVNIRVYQSHWNNGDNTFEFLTTVELPRRDDWLGW